MARYTGKVKTWFSRLDLWDLLVGVSILVYALVFSYFMLQKHHGFATYAWDLGIFDQAMYTTVFHRRLFYYTAELYLNPAGSYFAQKFSPILFLLTPLYYLAPSATTLLISKSFILALGALPLYLLSTEILEDKKMGFIMALVYLLYPALQSANTFSGYQLAFIPLLIFSMVYFLVKRKYSFYFIILILTVIVAEHLTIILAFFALVFLIAKNRSIFSLKSIRNLKLHKPDTISLVLIVTIVVSISGYFIARGVRGLFPITSEFAEAYLAVDTLSVLGFEGEILSLPMYLLSHPRQVIGALLYDYHLKLWYLVFLFAPLLFFPFKSKIIMPIMVFLGPTLLTNYSAYYMLGAHYPLYIVSFIILAALEGIRGQSLLSPSVSSEGGISSNLGESRSTIRKLPTLQNMVVVSLIFILSASPLSPAARSLTEENNLFWYSYPLPEKERDSLHRLMELVPSNASILTQNVIFPHFSNRMNAYVLPIHQAETIEQEEAITKYLVELIEKSDYILLNLKDHVPWMDYVLEKVEQSPSFKTYALARSIILFKRDYQDTFIFLPHHDYQVFTASEDLLITPHGNKIVEDSTSESGRVAFSPRDAEQGVFVYGPYIGLSPGQFQVKFETKVQNFSEGKVAKFEISDQMGDRIITNRILNSYNIPNEDWFNQTIPFNTKTLHSDIEFRVSKENTADLYINRIIVERIEEPEVFFFTYQNFFLGHGNKIVEDSTSESGRVAFSPRDAEQGVFVYGPFTRLPAGSFQVTFQLNVSEYDEGPVATFDVVDEEDNVMLARRPLYAFEVKPEEWVNLTLTFQSIEERDNYEFRVFKDGAADLSVDRVIVKKLSDMAEDNFGTEYFRHLDFYLGNGTFRKNQTLFYPAEGTSGFLWFGPYTTLPAGNFTASFFLNVNPMPREAENRLLTLDVVKSLGDELLAIKNVTGENVAGRHIGDGWYHLKLNFEVEQPTEGIEFRGLLPSSKYNFTLAYVLLNRDE